jgi:hypothetical protein
MKYKVLLYRILQKTTHDYILPMVKIEFNSMSLAEPYEDKIITTLINQYLSAGKISGRMGKRL